MPKIKTQTSFSSITILGAVVAAITLINFLFMLLARNEANTIGLLKKELITLEQEEKIIASAQNIYANYETEIETVSEVFPNDESIILFVQILETEIRANADEYTLKFSAKEPMKDKERLFLPMIVTMKTDLNRLNSFLSRLERLPFMTHVNTINGVSTGGFNATSDISLSIIVYVQNPFKTQ